MRRIAVVGLRIARPFMAGLATSELPRADDHVVQAGAGMKSRLFAVQSSGMIQGCGHAALIRHPNMLQCASNFQITVRRGCFQLFTDELDNKLQEFQSAAQQTQRRRVALIRLLETVGRPARKGALKPLVDNSNSIHTTELLDEAVSSFYGEELRSIRPGHSKPAVHLFLDLLRMNGSSVPEGVRSSLALKRAVDRGTLILRGL